MTGRIRTRTGTVRLPAPGLVPGLAVSWVVIALLIPPVAVDGQTEGVGRGEQLYRVHCLNCHGPQARGDGPMAQVLKKKPPDLTLIAARHDGEFPREQVHQAIDGRVRVRGHGLREMPVWGLSFQVRGLDGDQEREVQERLRALVSYLESIQREP